MTAMLHRAEVQSEYVDINDIRGFKVMWSRFVNDRFTHKLKDYLTVGPFTNMV